VGVAGFGSLALMLYISYFVESPRFHYIREKYAMSRLDLGYIAKVNTSDLVIFDFAIESQLTNSQRLDELRSFKIKSISWLNLF